MGQSEGQKKEQIRLRRRRQREERGLDIPWREQLADLQKFSWTINDTGGIGRDRCVAGRPPDQDYASDFPNTGS